MNRKGFTLIELIAMLVVISVLMIIAVPNISGIIKQNRESIGVEDVNKMVGNAKTKLSVGKAKYPEKGKCIVMSLNYIDSNSDFKTGVNGGDYDRNESVIIVKKEAVTGSPGTYTYKYYIRLVETKGTKNYIIGLVDFDTFSKNPSGYTSSLTELPDTKKFNMATATNDSAKTTIHNLKANLCNNGVTNIYK